MLGGARSVHAQSGEVVTPKREKNNSLGVGDFSKFVKFMHMASPYIQGHRGRTFVIAVPGEVRC